MLERLIGWIAGNLFQSLYGGLDFDFDFDEED